MVGSGILWHSWFKKLGYNELADLYTTQVFDRLNGLKADAPIHENYDTKTGRRLKSPNFSWSAAHLLMLYREYGISDIVSVGKQEMKVSVFPNPVVDYYTLKIIRM